MRSNRRSLRREASALLVTAVLGACGGGGGEAPVERKACDPVSEEPLDPRSTQHLLPGAPEPPYQSDPPTSGPHLVGVAPAGVLHEPLPRPVQVAVLEAGGVVVQHRGLADHERVRVEELAEGQSVVVSPATHLPAAVVATAWRHRLTCRGVDTDALRAFVAAYRGRVGHPPG